MDGVKILEETVEPSASSKWISYLIEGGILLLGLMLALLIRFAVYETTIVISKSMEPTLEANDRLLIDHRSSLRNNWQRGDIVMFAAPESWGSGGDLLIKRVIGLPGETIELRDNQVLINGRLLNESYIKTSSQVYPLPPLTLEKGSYFVMGDNRNNSEDSRVNGALPNRYIEGRAVFRLWPLSRIGRLPAPSY